MADAEQTGHGVTSDGEAPPTYEETLETWHRKRYELRRPHVLTRTVHAIDLDTGTLAYNRKMAGLLSSKMQFYSGTEPTPVWSCRRERDGFELVFSRKCSTSAPPLVQPDVSESTTEASHSVDTNDGIATDAAANLIDNKPADDTREYIHRENDDAPPAYEESDPATEQIVRLVSRDAFPFVFDFAWPSHSGSAPPTHQWLRNQEDKTPEIISPERPWSEFMCVERATGRMVAEVVHYRHQDPHLGTLVICGDLEPDQHEFLVVSAIPVVEEYPIRHLAHLNQIESRL
ncbi:hypothetical protein GGH19_000378 [Coemansia sp. RSA 1807]|nr:hypothetical protein LPJ58_003467 [Coemansia sp. RSA 1591]KAJ1760399.1 hypothetical protein LPJ69_003434 [Coemansia sp. RSA 1752]KAJ1786965.1 hypothetical protein LPJ67_003364 [Coemansia sp. RSA 1938]KAJ1790451.1 hypothetical protein LPJ62_001931 [Coemansia sp. RSA 2167]KAJ2256893.1 hypothetical protein GGH98_001224 [Coemansia sp. RSA 454]KAJ2442277.1 hypothetical protein IWW46_003107 [Coemansia sp. RSA 2440]KAJ2578557.1 hypothetical protein GGH19_000378 [Coemansia sp. RSA 1807]KAJ2652005